MTLVFINSSI